jgi:hypothetical protein
MSTESVIADNASDAWKKGSESHGEVEFIMLHQFGGSSHSDRQ